MKIYKFIFTASCLLGVMSCSNDDTPKVREDIGFDKVEIEVLVDNDGQHIPVAKNAQKPTMKEVQSSLIGSVWKRIETVRIYIDGHFGKMNEMIWLPSDPDRWEISLQNKTDAKLYDILCFMNPNLVQDTFYIYQQCKYNYNEKEGVLSFDFKEMGDLNIVSLTDTDMYAIMKRVYTEQNEEEGYTSYSYVHFRRLSDEEAEIYEREYLNYDEMDWEAIRHNYVDGHPIPTWPPNFFPDK